MRKRHIYVVEKYAHSQYNRIIDTIGMEYMWKVQRGMIHIWVMALKSPYVKGMVSRKTVLESDRKFRRLVPVFGY